MTDKPIRSVSYRQAAKMHRIYETWALVDREQDRDTRELLRTRALDEKPPRQVAHDYVMTDQKDALNPDYTGPRYYHAGGEPGHLRLKTPEEFALDERRRPQPEPHGSDDA